MAKRRRIIIRGACALLVGGIALVCYGVSPDGVYTATLHSVDTGAAGSYCQALLRRTSGGEEVVLVDGGWKFVEQMQWRGNRTLVVTPDFAGEPDASWPKSWQDVTIVYKEPLRENRKI